MVHLPGQMLEEAVELVEVAVGLGQKAVRIGTGAVEIDPRDVGDLDHELVAEALDRAPYADDVAALKASGQLVGIAKGPGRHRPANCRAARGPDRARRLG